MAASLIVPTATPIFAGGTVEPNATIEAFLSGTTTPVSLYTNSTLTTVASTADRTADANGVMGPLYYDSSVAIRIRYKDASGTVIPESDVDPYLSGGGGGGSDLIVQPDDADFPYSLYVGEINVDNLATAAEGGSGIGHNILIGRDILSNAYTGTDDVNPDQGYGHVMIGTRIGSQYMTNNRDNVLIGYENSFYLGNSNQLISIGAKANYGDLTRAAVSANPDDAPISGVVIGLVAFFDGLKADSQNFVGIGNNVGRTQTRSFETVYIGNNCGQHLGGTLYNVAIGASAMGGKTDNGGTNTIHNVAVGWECLGALKDGTQNIFMGSQAGALVQDGGNNIGIGHQALDELVAGNFNTAVGNQVATKFTGNDLVAIGDKAFNAMVSSQGSTGVGADFAPLATGAWVQGLGWNALPNLTTGQRNAALGAQAGATVTTGSNNVFLGNFTAGIAAGNEQTAIGDAATCTKGNQFMFGKTTVDFEYAFTNGYIKRKVYTVATLPNPATAGAGATAFVSDANATTFASVVAGGGSNPVPVYSDATNWRIG